ncbi:sensor histidine kinase KdpD [Roseomonas sp. 18066]|uniref:sensor histidine kinase n=1 Tax=Roseomonas sp. 18066 TaxID=2681412 RepID=UPI00135725E9|nr:sensor histidine kinase KdpD [Roseomonas sp. 18066]
MPDRPDDRPDPDALLRHARREGRGRLKVFLGAAPGVGKSFEMLAQARRLAAAGTDIVVGLIETHGRAETEAQRGALAEIPRRAIAYRGQVLAEFDLDAALARRPAILVLDELAHSNAPGSRHPKRWQDVEELRAAGIEVWTALNIQHLESLGEVVARITGIRVAERVPDAVLEGADSIELVDLPAAELRERLRQGRIYRPAQVEQALRGFFREGNLAALRELALRRTAERVDADLADYMRAKAIEGPWPVADRVLALLAGDGSAATVLQHARRLADALRAPLSALHVEHPGSPPLPEEALRLAEALGARVELLAQDDLAAAILARARALNVTHLVAGRPPLQGFLRRLRGRRLAAVLLRRGGDFHLHWVASPLPRPPAGPLAGRTPAEARLLPRWAGWLALPLLAGGATLLAFSLQGELPEAALGMLYLPVVVALAAWFGPLQGAAGALLSFILWNFLFLEPRYTLTLASGQEVVGAAVFGLVSLLLSGTTGRLGRSVRRGRARLTQLRRLMDFARRLAAAERVAELLDTVAEEARRLVDGPVCLLLPLHEDPTGLLPVPPGAPPDLVLRVALPAEAEPDEAALAAARWALQRGRPAGRDTDTLPNAGWQFRPLRTPRGVLALLGLQVPRLEAEREATLDAMLDQAGLALERLQLLEHSARSAARAETEQLRSTLLASVGHDLRTPLTSVRGALETLRLSGDRLSPATRDDLLRAAEEESERLSRYLSNLLDLVRLEAGQVTARRETVEAAEIFAAAAARLGRQHGRPVALALPAAPLLLRSDASLLEQILSNLLDNALKFSGPSGTVRASLRREGAEALFTIEDDGPGIPAEDLPRIFDPFFRAARTDRVSAGTGLGLGIARGLAHVLGGRLAPESPRFRGAAGEQGGTRMTLHLPA